MADDTEARLGALLEEQNRLLRKADRRGGCLWNLVMVLFFGIFYITWLIIKRLIKWVIWLILTVWAGLRWLGALIMRWTRSLVARIRS